MDTMDALQRIRELCQQRGYSCYELAKRSGIPYSTLNTLMLKKSNPSLSTLERICAGFGISLQQFFSDDSGSGSLTPEQNECLSLFSVLTSEEQALALAYMKGLSHQL